MAFRPSKENAARVVELLDFITTSTGEEAENKQLDTEETPAKQTCEIKESETEAATTTVVGLADKINKPAISLYRLVLEYATDQAACFEQYEALDQWVSKDGERALIRKILYGVARKAQQQSQKE